MTSSESLVERTWRDLEFAASATGALEVVRLTLPIEQVRALVEERRAPLPCDVQLPNTTFRKGVRLSTLLVGLGRRKGLAEDQTTFADRAALAEPDIGSEEWFDVSDDTAVITEASRLMGVAADLLDRIDFATTYGKPYFAGNVAIEAAENIAAAIRALLPKDESK